MANMNSTRKESFYLHTGNGGPWQCGVCNYTNFDTKIKCLLCKGIRPAFQPNFPWICLTPNCGYTINEESRDTCFKCHNKKWTPNDI
jgi:hypothetical protein